MKLIAGERGWSNSISFLMMLEDLTIIQNFKGKELAVTTGLGFQTEESMNRLVSALSEVGASGLIINTGKCRLYRFNDSNSSDRKCWRSRGHR